MRVKQIRSIERTMELVQEAQDLVDEAVKGTRCERYYLAYGRYGFNCLLGSGNPYDEGLNDLINPKNENEPHSLSKTGR